MDDLLFNLANLFVLPFWLLMIVLPTWSWTRRIVGSLWVLAPMPILYAVLAGPRLADLAPALANPTLPAIAAALGQPPVALVAWVHFLAFDLFVGRWIYLDSREKGRNPWIMALILFFTLMLGPLGLLLYLGLSAALRRPGATSDSGKASA